MSLIKLKARFEIFVIVLTFYSFTLAPYTLAQEFVISDNGTNSSSDINIQGESQTSVEQTNTATIDNSVTTESVTGQNEASGNTGESASIQTGNINTEVLATNEVNSSLVEQTSCCQTENTTEISGNGSDATNVIDTTQLHTSSTSINQTVSISNNIKGYVNTGRNTANDNTGGSVTIETGDVNVISNVVNGPVNLTAVNVDSGGLTGINSLISGNGIGSVNTVLSQITEENKVFINHSSEIENIVFWDLSTGENSANNNSGGDVRINTGDIDLALLIKNIANISGVEITCCQVFDPPSVEGKVDESDDKVGNSQVSDANLGGASSVGNGASAIGGPRILGLSDTSAVNGIQNIQFMLGLGILAYGFKLIGENLSLLRG